MPDPLEPCYILTRSDMIAAFRLWVETFRSEPESVNDNDAAVLARDVTKRIEDELEYPGQIKVTVLREKRIVEYAK